MSHEGEEIVDDTDDILGDVQNAFNEARGGEPAEKEPQIVLDKMPVRDESGKFVKAEIKQAKEPAPERKTLTLPEKDARTKAAEAQNESSGLPNISPLAASAAVEPPKGWTAEAKAKWSELPEWAQKEATRREEALTKQLFAHDEARDFGRKVMEAANPYLPMMRQEGADPHKAFENYLQTSYVLRQGTPIQKAQALQAIAQRFNVDLSLSHQQGAQDPRYAHLEQQVAGLSGELQETRNHLRNQEDQSLVALIQDFQNQPGHEHFEKVRYHMGVMMQEGQVQDIKEAYDRACWSDPEIRSTLIAAQSQAAQAQRAAELKAQSEKARNAAVSVTGAPGSSRPLNGTGSRGSIEDDVRAAMAEITGRV